MSGVRFSSTQAETSTAGTLTRPLSAASTASAPNLFRNPPKTPPNRRPDFKPLSETRGDVDSVLSEGGDSCSSAASSASLSGGHRAAAGTPASSLRGNKKQNAAEIAAQQDKENKKKFFANLNLKWVDGLILDAPLLPPHVGEKFLEEFHELDRLYEELQPVRSDRARLLAELERMRGELGATRGALKQVRDKLDTVTGTQDKLKEDAKKSKQVRRTCLLFLASSSTRNCQEEQAGRRPVEVGLFGQY